MATTAVATIDLSASFVGADQTSGAGPALRRMQTIGTWVGHAGGAVVGWFRAGQLGSDYSVDLARWSGARR